jgi:hypothetical protein
VELKPFSKKKTWSAGEKREAEQSQTTLVLEYDWENAMPGIV